MARWMMILVLLLGLGLAACSGGDLEIDDTDSQLTIVTAPGGLTVASPENRGVLNMAAGEQRQFRIRRSVSENENAPDITDVTADVDVNFTDPDVAAFNTAGQLTALATGFTTMEAVYRDGDADPTDDDKVYMDITVTAAP